MTYYAKAGPSYPWFTPMLRLCCLLVLYVIGPSVKAQMLSKTDALAVADRLYRVQILSDHGKAVLIDQIRKEDLRYLRYGQSRNEWDDGEIRFSRSGMLTFLKYAFLTDLAYRYGLLDYDRLYNNLLNEHGASPPSPADDLRLRTRVKKLMANFEGHRIEAAIEPEPGYVAQNEGFTWYMTTFADVLKPQLISHTRSVTGKTRRRTLRDLRNLGLLDEKVYETINEALSADQPAHEHTLIEYAAQLMSGVENYPQDRANEVALIEALHTAGILTEVGYRRLSSRPDGAPLLRDIDLLRHSGRAVIIRPTDLPADPETAYPKIYDTLRSIMPELSFQDLSVRRVAKEDAAYTDLVAYDLEVSFTIEERTYRNTFFYAFEEKMQEAPDTTLIIYRELTEGINRYLRDKNSNYRLYAALSYPERASWVEVSEPDFGLILLTQDEYDIWLKHDRYPFVSREDHTNNFTSDRIDSLLEIYRNLGLFVHLSVTELQAGRDCASHTPISSYQQLLRCFPKTIVYFDWETGNLENPYVELTQALAAASRGAFSPTNIQDNFAARWEEEFVDFSFQYAGRHYQEKLRMNGDWLDPRFMHPIGRAMTDNQVKGKFYYALDDGQAAGYLFLTPDQHAALLREQPDFFPDY